MILSVNKHMPYDLAQMQSLPLRAKIIMTQQRIRQWYEYWDGQVYVSFSGGKDSTVLLHICREMYPDIEAVFVDTGLEYPEIRQFVKTFDNVTWLRPEMSFKQVCQTYGYPFISKEVSKKVCDANSALRNGYTNSYTTKYFNGEALTPDGKKSPYNIEKWKPLVGAAFNISHKCCDVMKKKPAKQFGKATEKKPIIATMASESRLRYRKWIQYGCNAFEKGNPSSQPLSFWTEQDIYHYIKQNNLRIASVYGDIVVDEKPDGEKVLEGQMNLIDYLGEYEENDILTTTGCKRTGCMFCGFGCQIKGDTRFLDMKQTHPRQYSFIFKPESEGGLGYAEKIDYINEHCNTDIRY